MAARKQYVGALDQGTTSTRFCLFTHAGELVAQNALEHEQIRPKPGWVEHNPLEIWEKTKRVIASTCAEAGVTAADVVSVGITNQRETTLVWNKVTGKPYYNAIVWQDTRTADICTRLAGDEGQNRFQKTVGLPLVPYFSGTKIMWMLENVDGLRADAEKGDAVFGNVDSWLVWNLTGGTSGGLHITDVTNASRTLLMNLETLAWDEGMLSAFNVPKAMLPEIRSSSEVYGKCNASGFTLNGVAVAGILGDQQAALFGQACFKPGEAKNTYGTGCFLLANTGSKLVFSKHGLLSTVAYKIGDAPAVYGLEGSVAIAGSAVSWLRDNLKLITDAKETETMAKTVEDNGDCYLVPAFSGLFTPHWRNDARGVIVGLTGYVTRDHVVRATLESTAFQSYEVLKAMETDYGTPLTALKVDGGMVLNEFLMQFQSDLLSIPVVRPSVVETTALGAAYAAGLATGFWSSIDEVKENWAVDKEWAPFMKPEDRSHLLKQWTKAVERTFGWTDDSAGGGGESDSVHVSKVAHLHLAVGAVLGVAATAAFFLLRK